MTKRSFLTISAALMLSLSTVMTAPVNAVTESCGETPQTKPNVPDGAGATVDDIRIARNRVLSYSNSIDAYLTCMDTRANLLLPYMTVEQKERWDEDLTNLHNDRRDVQLELNEAIRAYRKAN